MSGRKAAAAVFQRKFVLGHTLHGGGGGDVAKTASVSIGAGGNACSLYGNLPTAKHEVEEDEEEKKKKRNIAAEEEKKHKNDQQEKKEQEESQREAKKARVEENVEKAEENLTEQAGNETKEEGGAAAAAAPTAEEEKKSPEEKLKEAIIKVTHHLKNDKKLTHAAAVFKNMLANLLTRENAALFVDPLQSMMSRDERVTDEKFRPTFMEIFKIVMEKKELFPEEHRGQVDNWCFHAHTINRIYTDDTFQFAKVLSEVTKQVESVSTMKSQDTATIRRKHLLVRAMEESYSLYKWLWARAPIEVLLRTATERREHFDSKDIPIIEKLWTTVKARKAAAVKPIEHKSFFSDDHRV